MTAPQTTRVTQALEEFSAALEAMPFGQDRIEGGQQFNAYECAENDEDDDPSDWEYLLCLGPITDAAFITRIDGQWRANLIDAALRVALHSLRHRAQAEAEAGAREAAFEPGETVTYVGVDGSWRLQCTVVENVEGWWLVRFRDHTDINPSEAIVRPSSLAKPASEGEG